MPSGREKPLTWTVASATAVRVCAAMGRWPAGMRDKVADADPGEQSSGDHDSRQPPPPGVGNSGGDQAGAPALPPRSQAHSPRGSTGQTIVRVTLHRLRSRGCHLGGVTTPLDRPSLAIATGQTLLLQLALIIRGGGGYASRFRVLIFYWFFDGRWYLGYWARWVWEWGGGGERPRSASSKSGGGAARVRPPPPADDRPVASSTWPQARAGRGDSGAFRPPRSQPAE